MLANARCSLCGWQLLILPQVTLRRSLPVLACAGCDKVEPDGKSAPPER